MRRRICSLLLAVSMLISAVPVAYATDGGIARATTGTPNGFLKAVSLPLMPARTSGLYEEPDTALPAVDGKGFLRSVEGWTPQPVETGLPTAVEEPDPAATPISSAEDLQKMAAGGSFVLTQDIDLTDVAWTPLFTKSSVTLDGQGYAIRGFRHTVEYGDSNGFFGFVEGDLTVKNLRFEDATLTLAYEKETVYGYAIGTLASGVRKSAALQNVVAEVTVVQAGTLQNTTGGLIGFARQSLIVEDCAVSVTYKRAENMADTALSCQSVFGGIAGGANDESRMERVYIEMNLQTEAMGGCAVGGMLGSVGKVQIKDCLVTGTIASDGGVAGGMLGSAINTQIRMENCVSSVDIAGANIAGGFHGKMNQYCHGEYELCRYSGTMTPYANGVNAGGFVGQQVRSSLVVWTSAADVKIQPPVQDAAAPTLSGSIGGIVGLSDGSSYDCIGCNVRLQADGLHNKNIELGGLSGGEVYGSFGYAEACYGEVTMRNANLYGGASVGGLMGYNRAGTLLNCGAKVQIDLENQGGAGICLGGLTAYSYSGVDMSRCYATGSVSLDHNGKEGGSSSVSMGGLLGSGMTGASSTLVQCYANVSLEVVDSHLSNSTAMGGLAGSLNNHGSVTSSWSNASLRCTNADKTNDYGYTKMAARIGGLVGAGGISMMDCAFVGTMQCYGQRIGGLIGNGMNLFRNCYAKTNLSAGQYQGGIVAETGDVCFYDCYFDGSLENAETVAGGIAAVANDSKFYRCKADATIEGADITAGGILGTVYQMEFLEDCTFRGSVRGAVVGGILGDGSCSAIRNCTVDATLGLKLEESPAFAVGGMMGKAYTSTTFENCRMKQQIKLYGLSDGLTRSVLGGICGSGGKYFLNCSSGGVSISGGASSFSVDAGGIAGSCNSESKFENCKVNGGVSASARTGQLRLGGITSVLTTGSVKNCSVTGTVSGSLNPNAEQNDGNGTLSVGGLVGMGEVNLILSNSYHSGTVSAYSSAANTGINKGPLVGNNKYKNGSVGSMDASEKTDEAYTIRVFWYPERYEIGESLTQNIDNAPLEGAAVRINGQAVGVTGKDGMLTVNSNDLSTSSSTMVKATKEGYHDAERDAVLSKDGVLTLNMKKKTPGVIYMKNVELTVGDNEPREVLNTKNRTYLQQLSSPPQVIQVTMDWNDLKTEGREVWLQNQDGSKKLTIYDNVEYPVNLHTFFDKDEDIYLQAKGVDQQGEPVETPLYKLAISVIDFQPKLVVEGEKHPVEGLEWMEGLEIGFELGELLQRASEVQISNNVVTFKFGKKADIPNAVLTNSNLEIAVNGNLMLTFDETGLGDWMGGVEVSGTMKPLYGNVTQIKSAPVLIVTEIDAGMGAGMGVSGKYEYPVIDFPVTVKFDASFAVGAGVGVKDFYVMPLALELGANGEAILHVQPQTSDGWDVDAKLEGFIGFTVQCKGMEWVELDACYKVGGFRWEAGKDAVFFSPNDEIPISFNSMNWEDVDRDYLNNGGGFCCSLQAVSEEDAGGPVQVYENVMAGSGSALTVENGMPVLYFTADDGRNAKSGTVSQHTALWRTEQKAGIWSQPTMVADSEAGFPDGVDADGPFAVWVNSSETDSFDGLLTSTDVVVAMNGSVIGTFDGDGYVYGVEVAASEDGTSALVTWLRDETVSAANLVPENPELHYARYSNGSWSQGQVNVSGNEPMKALPRMTTGEAIFWQTDDGVLMKATGNSFDTVERVLDGVYDAAVFGNYTASMAEDGVLTIWNGSSVETVLPTNGSAVSKPVMVQGEADMLYVVWAASDGIYYADSGSAWAGMKKICETTTVVSSLSAAVVDGELCVSYTNLDQAGTSTTSAMVGLYVAQAPDLTGVDLAVTDLTAVEDDLTAAGILDLSAVVTNLRETAATAFTYSVTDEKGTVVTSGTYDGLNLTYGAETDCRSLFAPDVTTAHSYTLTVQPVDAVDADPSNNTMTIQMQPDPEIVQTGFQAGLGTTTELEVLVTNTGAAPVETMTVEVYQMTKNLERVGEALICKEFTNVSAGSYRQVLLERVKENAYYNVVLSQGDTVVDETVLMCKSNSTEIDVFDTNVENGVVTVELAEQGNTSDAMVVFAVYDRTSGQMLRAETKDLSGGYRTEFDAPEDFALYQYRVFVLDKDTGRPLCEAVTS